MTVAELREECKRVRAQGFHMMVIRIERHGSTRMQVMKGLMGSVVGSDRFGSFVAVDIAKTEAKLADMSPDADIPKVSHHRAKVLP